MDELKRLITRRKIIRSKITSIFNKRNQFSDFAADVRAVELADLLEYQKNILDLDSKILELKDWDTDEVLENEFVTCEDYQSKIRNCLTLLNLLSSSSVSSSRNDASS